MKTKKCKQCYSFFLDVKYLSHRVKGFCCEKCYKAFQKESERIKAWREELNALFPKKE